MLNNIQDVAFAVGIVLGAILLLAVGWVWVRKQILGASGMSLAIVGLALVGLSFWTSIRIEASTEGIVAQFEQRLDELNNMIEDVDSNVQRVASTSLEVSDEVGELRSAVAINGQQFQVLTAELARERAVSAPDLDRIREGITIPQTDNTSVNIRRRQLETIINR